MAKLGCAMVCVKMNILNLDYVSYKKICDKIEEIIRYETVKEEMEKLCNIEAVVTVIGHEHYSDEE